MIAIGQAAAFPPVAINIERQLTADPPCRAFFQFADEVLTRPGVGPRLDGARVAVPGERTTAYLLFRLWAAGHHPAAIEVVPFDRIMPGVRDGAYDAGLVIHDHRHGHP